MKLKSPAKINLYLRVLNKRPDGYHDIVTLFERIGLFDEITLRRGGSRPAPTLACRDMKPGQAIKITCTDPKIPTGPKNLAYKAAQALLDYTGRDLSCHINIKKRIPVAAGLGGGSSNAATVLIGLNHLWKMGLSRKELMKIGAVIGADVNFFLSGVRFAIGRGRGEQCSPLHIKNRLWHVLIYPGKGLSTKSIYDYWDRHCEPNEVRRSNLLGARRLLRSPLRGSLAMTRIAARFPLTAALADVKILLHSIRSNDLTLLAKNLHNDLEEPATVKDDAIFKARAILSSCKAKCALMSGSGSVVFGITPSRNEAARIKQEVSRLKRGWHVFAARTY